MNASSPRTARKLDNEVAKIAAVVRNQWKNHNGYDMRTASFTTLGTCSTFWRSVLQNFWTDIACFIIGSLFNCRHLLSEYEKILMLFEKSKSASRFSMATLEVLSLAPT